jgi:hypothetical protein
MASNNVFVIYSESDQGKVSKLIKDIRNVTPFPLDQIRTQIDEADKSKILKCGVFLCFLSSNSSPLLFNIVKFARCVARKKINAYFIEPDGFLKTKEELSFSNYKESPKKIEYSSDIGIQNFFKYKTNIITSISDIEEVSIILEFINFNDHSQI